MKKLFLLAALLLVGRASLTSLAQSPANANTFPLGIVDEIQSSSLSEKRILNIYLPDDYDKSPDSYPVIYLLDGSANEDFVHIVGLVQFLTMIQAMPNTIVVGIANVDRKRDFTFPTTIEKDKKDYPTTGGSDHFITFVEKDLEPYIEHKYRCNNSKTIIGQSLGGLVATEMLLKKPSLFNTYIIVSPSIWWDNESLLTKAPAFIKSLPASPLRIYITTGAGEEKRMTDDAKKLAALLKSFGKPNLKVDFVLMPGENHLTILHNAIYKALTKLNGKNK